MQTFLPYSDLEQTAKVLDYRRLGKMRVESWQILNTLSGKSKGWVNHPAVKMWAGYEWSLAKYGRQMCQEWIQRGYKDTMYVRFLDYLNNEIVTDDPPWLGNEDFHASHRSNLLRKDPVYYKQFGWSEPDNLPYIWPTN